MLLSLRQTAQAELAKPNLIAQLREESFYLVSSTACCDKLWRLTEISNMLAHVLIPVEGLLSIGMVSN